MRLIKKHSISLSSIFYVLLILLLGLSYTSNPFLLIGILPIIALWILTVAYLYYKKEEKELEEWEQEIS